MLLKTQNMADIKGIYLIYYLIYTFFDKKTSVSGIKNEIMSNKEVAEELNKKIIRKFEYTQVHPIFINNIWGC